MYNNRFIKILNKASNKNIIIVPKKNIKKAFMRVRMRRKVRALLRKFQPICNFVVIVKCFYDFKQTEFNKIQNKINEYVKENVKILG